MLNIFKKYIRYKFSVKYGQHNIELSMNGGNVKKDVEKRGNPSNTEVRLSCIDLDTNKIVWENDYGNIVCPSALWNKQELIHIIDDYVYVALSNTVNKLSPVNGESVWKVELGINPIDYLMPFMKTNTIIAHNQAGLVNKHYGHGMIYSLNYDDGSIFWEAEFYKDGIHGSYTGIGVQDGKIYAGAWAGYTHKLDPATGKVIESIFTK